MPNKTEQLDTRNQQLADAENMLTKHLSVLSIIEETPQGYRLELPEDTTMKYLSKGEVAHVFLLQSGDKKLVLRVPNPSKKDISYFDSEVPYIKGIASSANRLGWNSPVPDTAYLKNITAGQKVMIYIGGTVVEFKLPGLNEQSIETDRVILMEYMDESNMLEPRLSELSEGSMDGEKIKQLHAIATQLWQSAFTQLEHLRVENAYNLDRKNKDYYLDSNGQVKIIDWNVSNEVIKTTDLNEIRISLLEQPVKVLGGYLNRTVEFGGAGSMEKFIDLLNRINLEQHPEAKLFLNTILLTSTLRFAATMNKISKVEDWATEIGAELKAKVDPLVELLVQLGLIERLEGEAGFNFKQLPNLSHFLEKLGELPTPVLLRSVSEIPTLIKDLNNSGENVRNRLFTHALDEIKNKLTIQNLRELDIVEIQSNIIELQSTPGQTEARKQAVKQLQLEFNEKLKQQAELLIEEINVIIPVDGEKASGYSYIDKYISKVDQQQSVSDLDKEWALIWRIFTEKYKQPGFGLEGAASIWLSLRSTDNPAYKFIEFCRAYLKKRQELIDGESNLVAENIDILPVLKSEISPQALVDKGIELVVSELVGGQSDAVTVVSAEAAKDTNSDFSPEATAELNLESSSTTQLEKPEQTLEELVDQRVIDLKGDREDQLIILELFLHAESATQLDMIRGKIIGALRNLGGWDIPYSSIDDSKAQVVKYIDIRSQFQQKYNSAPIPTPLQIAKTLIAIRTEASRFIDLSRPILIDDSKVVKSIVEIAEFDRQQAIAILGLFAYPGQLADQVLNILAQPGIVNTFEQSRDLGDISTRIKLMNLGRLLDLQIVEKEVGLEPGVLERMGILTSRLSRYFTQAQNLAEIKALIAPISSEHRIKLVELLSIPENKTELISFLATNKVKLSPGELNLGELKQLSDMLNSDAN